MLHFGKERKIIIVMHVCKALNSANFLIVVNVNIFLASKADGKTTGSISVCF